MQHVIRCSEGTASVGLPRKTQTQVPGVCRRRFVNFWTLDLFHLTRGLGRLACLRAACPPLPLSWVAGYYDKHPTMKLRNTHFCLCHLGRLAWNAYQSGVQWEKRSKTRLLPQKHWQAWPMWRSTGSYCILQVKNIVHWLCVPFLCFWIPFGFYYPARLLLLC